MSRRKGNVCAPTHITEALNADIEGGVRQLIFREGNPMSDQCASLLANSSGKYRPEDDNNPSRERPHIVKAVHYVGRVGALAVALGIGAAMFAGTGVARADDDGTSSAPSNSASTPKKSTGSSAKRPSSSAASTRSTSGSKSSPAGGNSTNARDSLPRVTSSSVSLRTVSTPTAATPSETEDAASLATSRTTVVQTNSTTTQRGTAPVVASVTAMAAPPAASAISGLISPVLDRLPTPGSPALPSQIAAMLALVTAAGRELQHTFFNQSPVITSYTKDTQTVSADGNTVTITGKITASDPDGDPLTYSVLGGSARGGLVTVDESGNYTYTAPFTADLGRYDDFNVIVSEANVQSHFHGPLDLLSRVPVIGPLVAGFIAPYDDGVTSTRVAVLATPATTSAVATGTGAELSSTPVAQRGDWQQYVLTPQGCSSAAPCSVKPTSIYYKNADVTVNADGTVTLNYRLGGDAPVVIFDYGQEVGGFSQYNVVSASSPNILQSAYSETSYNMSPIGDGALSAVLLANSGSGITAEAHPILGSGEITGGQIQGGYRYQRVTLTAPGSVTLGVSTNVTAPLKSADEYAGYFLSNSDLLNRIWYAGAYTVNISEIASGTPGNAGPYDLSILAEAAKRDRAIWAGDLQTSLPTLSAVFGPAGTILARNNLSIIGANPQRILFPLFSSLAAGTGAAAMPGVCKGSSSTGCSFYSATYSMNYVANMNDYYHTTGDISFVAQNWNNVQRELKYEQSLVNPSTGLVNVPLLQSLDWSLTVRPGTQTAANVLHYRSLTSAADMATALAANTTDAGQKAEYLAEADSYTQQAADLKQRINATLWNEQLGAYDASTGQRGVVVQDANSWAVLYGVADEQQSARIAQTLVDALDTPYGLRIADPSIRNINLILINIGYPAITSPFASGFTLDADYLAGRPDLAMNLMTEMWGHMANSDAGSTAWERINLPGGNLAAPLNLQADLGCARLGHRCHRGIVEVRRGHHPGYRRL
ncbi:Ig-like domain-containing protein [Mycolicibacterium psychrotolerans]|uniref:alpha-L-rhamnosidase-related protein n=1 Tax=Mycolicibacterium psychrotolerans TaxID=216929 RepID=UPI003D667762